MEVETEMEMEMRATEDIDISTDITPPLTPLSFSLYTDSPDISTALRLLLLHHRRTHSGRISGLLSNRHKLTCQNDELSDRISLDAGHLASALANHRGETEPNDGVLEEATVSLCAVLTNAVEVQDNEGRNIGIAVFGPTFSWINHSCSPNACYRFTFSSSSHSPESKLRIAPFTRDSQQSQTDSGVWCSSSEFAKEEKQGYGPRLIVRSIKRIKKGEEVTVAYTDLLQPNAMRQSELWSKYRFICCCKRCSALPFTYVDRALQEIYVSSHDLSGSCSNFKFLSRNMADRRLTEYIDDVISEYLSVGDPESCCKKLEKMLMQGLNELLEGAERNSHYKFMLHPLHYLSLNAYTTLASAYKVRASDSLSAHSGIDANQLEAFDLSRTSAAYSLLLAGATHHLFNSESSIIASVANFWMGAGKSLLSLTRSSGWSEFVKLGQDFSNLFSVTKFKCSKCTLMDRFRACISNGQIRSTDFEDTSNEFLHCVSNTTQKVWSFLVHGCHFLRSCKDPIDFSWLEPTMNSSTVDVGTHVNKIDVCSSHESATSIYICEEHAYADHTREHIFQLSVHCLVYGGLLAIICYGHHSHLACHVQNILDQEESFFSSIFMRNFERSCTTM